MDAGTTIPMINKDWKNCNKCVIDREKVNISRESLERMKVAGENARGLIRMPLSEFPTELFNKRMSLLKRSLATWTDDPLLLLNVESWVQLVEANLMGTDEIIKYRTSARREGVIRNICNLFMDNTGYQVCLEIFNKNKIPTEQIDRFTMARNQMCASGKMDMALEWRIKEREKMRMEIEESFQSMEVDSNLNVSCTCPEAAVNAISELNSVNTNVGSNSFTTDEEAMITNESSRIDNDENTPLELGLRTTQENVNRFGGTEQLEEIELDSFPPTPSPPPAKKSRRVISDRKLISQKKSHASVENMSTSQTSKPLRHSSFSFNFNMSDIAGMDMDMFEQCSSSEEYAIFPRTPPIIGIENIPQSLFTHIRPHSAPHLTSAMKAEVRRRCNDRTQEKVIEKFTLTVTVAHLALYGKRNWLEDRNIDFYLEMIRERNNAPNSGFLKIFVYQSFFYKMFRYKGYNAVIEVTGDENIFTYSMVFFPVHLSDHWRLIVADFEEGTLTSYNSMEYSKDSNLNVICNYLRLEERRLNCQNMSNLENLTLISKIPGLPQQTNGSDCGIFVLQYADYLARRVPPPFDFTQAHIPYFRQRMAYETMKGELLPIESKIL